MGYWELDNLAKVARGRWLSAPADGLKEVQGVSTDTRTLLPGAAYVAIKGPRFDGHDFLTNAAAAGVSLLIVSRDIKKHDLPEGVPVLLVHDGIKALGDLAAAYRDALGRANVKVVGVTGSNGKTTTRHMIHTLLSVSMRGTQSPKSFNNHIGVPLTLLAAREDDDFVVVEIGTSRPGEIDALSRIIRPDVGVITNVGPAHLEGFGTVENVAAEKAALLSHTREAAVIADTPPTDSLLRPHVNRVNTKVIRFGAHPASDVRVVTVEPTDAGLRVDLDTAGKFTLPFMGKHNAMNLAAAMGVARHVHGNTNDASGYQAALKAIQPIDGRLQEMRFGNLRVIHDAYNANPASVAAAIHTLTELRADRRVLVLGDMLELGAASEREHAHIGNLIATTGAIDRVVLVGRSCGATHEALRGTGITVRWHQQPDDQTPEQIAQTILSDGYDPKTEAVVLLKGSRALGLERVINAIDAACRPDQSHVSHGGRG